MRAIDEALAEYPQYNWMYIESPRFRADSGGWQNHLPSNDSKHEVVVIESIFRLVCKCEKIVHTDSGFTDYIYRSMNGADAFHLTSQTLIRLRCPDSHILEHE
jgi:hypothetical protein